MPMETYNDLVKQFKLLIIEKDKDIQKQDASLGALFIISSGQASFVYNGKIVGPCSRTSFISELDFLLNCKRPLGIKTITRCTLWTIDRSVCSTLFLSLKNQHLEKLKKALVKSELFSGFSDFLKVELIKIAFPVFYQENDVILKENQENLYVFVVVQGTVLVDHGKIEQVLNEGQVFGNFSFFMMNSASPRVQAVSQVGAFVMRLEMMIDVLGNDFQEKFLRRLVFNTLTSDEYTQEMPEHILKKLVDSFKFVNIPQGKCAINGNKALGKKILILLHGIISASQKTFQAPQLFGFFNKNYLTVGNQKFFCVTDSLFAELSTSELEKLVKSSYEEYVNEIALQVELSKIPFLSCFNKKYLNDLIKRASLKKYEKNSFIFKEGDQATSLFCITQGSVGLYEKEEFLFRFDTGCIFGETCLKSVIRENSSKALTIVVCYEFPKIHILQSINEKVLKYVDRSLYYYRPLEIDDLILQSPLATAKSRDYCIGTSADGKNRYFLEVVNKKGVRDNESFFLIVEQKCALAQMTHSGLLRFLRTVSSPVQVIFVYEYLEFVTLDWFKTQINPMQAKFIIASLAGVLSYLHGKYIMHRNVQPGNVAFDVKGFVKLVGFKFCKQCKGRSFTILDTCPAYKAKETLMGNGYLQASEAWSVGVLLFELLTGKLPFDIENSDSVVVITEKVLNNSLKIPDNVEECDKELILKLLDENFKKRITLSQVASSEWVKPYFLKEVNLQMVESPLDGLVGTGKPFVNCERYSWRRLTRRETTGTKVSDFIDELEWDTYF
jgi:serine/threonine protein kinase